MKRSLIPTLALLALTQSQATFAVSPATTPIEADTQLQISVDDTVARIRDVLTQMQQTLPSNQSLYGSDFVSAHHSMMGRVGPALEKIQVAVTHIQAQLQLHLDRFHTASLSSDLTERQKRELLELIKSDIQAKVPELTTQYQEKISAAYEAVFSLPYVVRQSAVVNPRRRAARALGCARGTDVVATWSFQSVSGGQTLLENGCLSKAPGISRLAVTPEVRTKIRDRWVLPVVLEGCNSRSCMSLMRDASLRFLEQMDSQINRPLSIQIGRPGQIEASFGISLARSPIVGASQYVHLLATPWQQSTTIPFIAD